jgi:hypothetical protein
LATDLSIRTQFGKAISLHFQAVVIEEVYVRGIELGVVGDLQVILNVPDFHSRENEFNESYKMILTS